MSNTRPFPKTTARARREQAGVQLRIEPHDPRALDHDARTADITLADRIAHEAHYGKRYTSVTAPQPREPKPPKPTGSVIECGFPPGWARGTGEQDVYHSGNGDGRCIRYAGRCWLGSDGTGHSYYTETAFEALMFAYGFMFEPGRGVRGQWVNGRIVIEQTAAGFSEIGEGGRGHRYGEHASAWTCIAEAMGMTMEGLYGTELKP